MDKKGYNKEKSDKKGDIFYETQEDLASQLGISKRTLLRYESGVSEPTISVLISLSLLFNVSVDYIIGTKDTTEIDEISIKNELDHVIQSLEKIKKEL